MDWLNSLILLFPQGTIALAERNLMLQALMFMLIVAVPVFGLIFFFAWHYRAGNTTAKYTPDWAHSNLEELIWWAIPLEIVLILGALTWTSTHELDPRRALSDTPPIVIEAVALDWKWLFIYPEQKIATLNYVEIPAGRPVEFRVTADAPMNSLWIPSLGGQIYAMTGMVNELNLEAPEPGRFDGRSANYSGPGFKDMQFVAQADTQEDFDAWVKSVQGKYPELNDEAYATLAKPATSTPTSFGSVKGDIFARILGKYMDSNASSGDAHYHLFIFMDQTTQPVQSAVLIPRATNLFKRGYAFYKANFKLLCRIWILPACMALIGSTVPMFISSVTVGLAFSIGWGIVTTAVTCFALFATVYMAAHPSEPLASAGAAYKKSASLFWSVAWTYLLSALAVQGVLTILAIGVVVVYGLLYFLEVVVLHTSFLAILVAVCLAFAGLFITVAASIYLSFSYIARISDDRRGVSALVYSWFYVKNRLGTVFSRGIALSLYSLLFLIPIFLFGVVSGIYSASQGTTHAPDPAWLTVLLNVYSAAAFTLFLTPVLTIAGLYLYQALKDSYAPPSDEAAIVEKKTKLIKVCIGFGIVQTVLILIALIAFSGPILSFVSSPDFQSQVQKNIQSS